MQGDFTWSNVDSKYLSPASDVKGIPNIAGVNRSVLMRLREFGGDRSPVFYDKKLQAAHHIHFPANQNHRILQHHYGKLCIR